MSAGLVSRPPGEGVGYGRGSLCEGSGSAGQAPVRPELAEERRRADALPEERDQHLGTLAAKVDVTLGDGLTLSAYGAPRVRRPAAPARGAAGGAQRAATQGAGALGRGALRLDRTGGDVDWSLSRIPRLPAHTRGAAGSRGGAPAALELRAHPIDALGADVARNFGRTGFRAESLNVNVQGTASSSSSVIPGPHTASAMNPAPRAHSAGDGTANSGESTWPSVSSSTRQARVATALTR